MPIRGSCCGCGGGCCCSVGGTTTSSGAPPVNPTSCTGVVPNRTGPAVTPTAPTAAVDASARPTLTFDPTSTPLIVAPSPASTPLPLAAAPAAGTSSTSTPACARSDEQTSRSSSWVARHDGQPCRCALIRSASAPVTLPAVNPPSFSTTERQESGPRFTERCACKYAARRP